MRKINQKKIEKRNRKRKERIAKFKNHTSTQSNIRDSYTAKTSQELEEYLRFIEGNAEIEPTNELTAEKTKIEKKENELKKEKKEQVESSDIASPQSTEEYIGDIKKRKQGPLERLRRSYYRKWPDNAVDLFFNAPSTIAISLFVAWASYFLFAKHDINELRSDISNQNGDMRKALVSDVAKNTLDTLSEFVNLKISSNNQVERNNSEKMVDKKIQAIIFEKAK